MIDIGTKSVLANVSGGGQSAIALCRCIEWYGKDRVVAVFADTGTEDPDLYHLLDCLEARLGITIHRLVTGSNIWDCFFLHRLIIASYGGGACKASVEMKHTPLSAFRADYPAAQWVIAAGMSWMETDRQERFAKRQAPWDVIFPLNEKPRLSDCDIVDELRRLDLPVADVYSQHGYPHNNCGGACVKAGIAQWIALLQDYPERFGWSEYREQLWQQYTGSDFTILKDRRDGKILPYSLQQLRHDVENGRELPPDFRSGCGCMTLFS